MPIAIQMLLLIPTMDEEAFIWLIRRQATNTQAESGCGHLHVAVEHAEQPGSVLAMSPIDLILKVGVKLTVNLYR
ncbi:hypothetical protein QUA81_00255 [Microcoleus sp. F6_B4]